MLRFSSEGNVTVGIPLENMEKASRAGTSLAQGRRRRNAVARLRISLCVRG